MIDIRPGSLWHGSGKHEQLILQVKSIGIRSLKVKAITGPRSTRSKLWTVPIDKFIRSHKPA